MPRGQKRPAPSCGRAELVAIHIALTTFSTRDWIGIFTNSLSSLQAIRHHHTNPGTTSAKHCHHHKLLMVSITDLLETRRLSGLRCPLASAARSWSGGTGTARGSCQMSPHLLAVGAGNSPDPDPARLRQEAKRGARWRLQPIGEEIMRCSRHHRCSLEHLPV